MYYEYSKINKGYKSYKNYNLKTGKIENKKSYIEDCLNLDFYESNPV